METSPPPQPESSASDPPPSDPSWDEHYCDERDAAYLYRALAAVEHDQDRKHLFERLAVVEDRHAERWRELFAQSGRPLPAYSTARRTRLLAWIAKHFGTSVILPLMLAEEGREVQAYLGMARHSKHRQTHKAAIDIASDSAVHARELAEMMGREGEPWHVGGSGRHRQSHGCGLRRLPQNHRLRFQRRAHGELRARRRRARRGRRTSYRDYQWCRRGA